VNVERFDLLLREAYEAGSGTTMDAMGGLDEETDLANLAQDIPEQSDLLESEDEAPVIRLINALLTQAVREGASDVHLEIFESRALVRFRVDGVLREVLRPQKAVAQPVVSRIKVMAKLDIAEKRLPQDGRISLRIAGRPVDVRVSTIPAGFGERVVLRLLDKQAGRLDLAELGMDPVTLAHVDRLIHRPHGILLVTGPTGSGKTTTLYAALSRLNDSTRNILTVEDPIEYYLDGIGQTQVNPKVEMTFARGLRAILRQDPDVVMVGEIRDVETAQVAVQASLTGHLVLSTVHTNDAVGAITRLRDMGVEPFLLASTLRLVLAQRLVRRLCDHCKAPRAPDPASARLFGDEPPAALFQAVGCARCNHLGYTGRVAIYEAVRVDETLRAMISEQADDAALARVAFSSAADLRDAARRCVASGQTTVEEALRVVRQEEKSDGVV
jgi:general secretion pathway protein E